MTGPRSAGPREGYIAMRAFRPVIRVVPTPCSPILVGYLARLIYRD